MKEESTLLPFSFFLFHYLRNDNSRDKTLENISSSELRKNDNKLKSLSSSASLDPRRLHSRVSMFHIMSGHAEASEARALSWVYGLRLFAFRGKIGEWSFLLSSRLVSKLLQIFFKTLTSNQSWNYFSYWWKRLWNSDIFIQPRQSVSAFQNEAFKKLSTPCEEKISRT